MARPTAHDRHSDQHLVELCNTGSDREATLAFEALYRRHKEFVLRVAFRYCGNRDGALDALQETFTYLLRQFPPTGDGLALTAQLRSLLYPVARSSAITQRRKVERFPSSGTEPDDIAVEPADDYPIEGLLSDLPEERREVVLLRFVEDLSLQEIADAMNIPLGTVKSRLHLALRQLRDAPGTKNFFPP